MTPRSSPEEVDAVCAVLRVPGGGLSRADVVTALEAAAEVRGVAPEARAVAAVLAMRQIETRAGDHPEARAEIDGYNIALSIVRRTIASTEAPR